MNSAARRLLKNSASVIERLRLRLRWRTSDLRSTLPSTSACLARCGLA